MLAPVRTGAITSSYCSSISSCVANTTPAPALAAILVFASSESWSYSTLLVRMAFAASLASFAACVAALAASFAAVVAFRLSAMSCSIWPSASPLPASEANTAGSTTPVKFLLHTRVVPLSISTPSVTWLDLRAARGTGAWNVAVAASDTGVMSMRSPSLPSVL